MYNNSIIIFEKFNNKGNVVVNPGNNTHRLSSSNVRDVSSYPEASQIAESKQAGHSYSISNKLYNYLPRLLKIIFNVKPKATGEERSHQFRKVEDSSPSIHNVLKSVVINNENGDQGFRRSIGADTVESMEISNLNFLEILEKNGNEPTTLEEQEKIVINEINEVEDLESKLQERLRTLINLYDRKMELHKNSNFIRANIVGEKIREIESQVHSIKQSILDHKLQALKTAKEMGDDVPDKLLEKLMQKREPFGERLEEIQENLEQLRVDITDNIEHKKRLGQLQNELGNLSLDQLEEMQKINFDGKLFEIREVKAEKNEVTTLAVSTTEKVEELSVKEGKVSTLAVTLPSNSPKVERQQGVYLEVIKEPVAKALDMRNDMRLFYRFIKELYEKNGLSPSEYNEIEPVLARLNEQVENLSQRIENKNEEQSIREYIDFYSEIQKEYFYAFRDAVKLQNKFTKIFLKLSGREQILIKSKTEQRLEKIQKKSEKRLTKSKGKSELQLKPNTISIKDFKELEKKYFKDLDASSYAIKITQHLPRVPLLLSEIEKKADADSDLISKISKAKESFKKQMVSVSETSVVSDLDSKYEKIQEFLKIGRTIDEFVQLEDIVTEAFEYKKRRRPGALQSSRLKRKYMRLQDAIKNVKEQELNLLDCLGEKNDLKTDESYLTFFADSVRTNTYLSAHKEFQDSFKAFKNSIQKSKLLKLPKARTGTKGAGSEHTKEFISKLNENASPLLERPKLSQEALKELDQEDEYTRHLIGVADINYRNIFESQENKSAIFEFSYEKEQEGFVSLDALTDKLLAIESHEFRQTFLAGAYRGTFSSKELIGELIKKYDSIPSSDQSLKARHDKHTIVEFISSWIVDPFAHSGDFGTVQKQLNEFSNRINNPKLKETLSTRKKHVEHLIKEFVSTENSLRRELYLSDFYRSKLSSGELILGLIELYKTKSTSEAEKNIILNALHQWTTFPGLHQGDLKDEAILNGINQLIYTIYGQPLRNAPQQIQDIEKKTKIFALTPENFKKRLKENIANSEWKALILNKDYEGLITTTENREKATLVLVETLKQFYEESDDDVKLEILELIKDWTYDPEVHGLYQDSIPSIREALNQLNTFTKSQLEQLKSKTNQSQKELSKLDLLQAIEKQLKTTKKRSDQNVEELIDSATSRSYHTINDFILRALNSENKSKSIEQFSEELFTLNIELFQHLSTSLFAQDKASTFTGFANNQVKFFTFLILNSNSYQEAQKKVLFLTYVAKKLYDRRDYLSAQIISLALSNVTQLKFDETFSDKKKKVYNQVANLKKNLFNPTEIRSLAENSFTLFPAQILNEIIKGGEVVAKRDNLLNIQKIKNTYNSLKTIYDSQKRTEKNLQKEASVTLPFIKAIKSMPLDIKDDISYELSNRLKLKEA